MRVGAPQRGGSGEPHLFVAVLRLDRQEEV